MSYGRTSGLVCVVLACFAQRAWAAAPTAEEKAALAELKKLTAVQFRTAEEAKQKFTELLPKVEAFAEKHAHNRAGGRALLAAADIALRLEQNTRALAACDQFVRRHSTDPAAPSIRYYQACAKQQLRDYAGARKVLVALLDDHPQFGGKARVQELLAIVKSVGTEAPDFTTKDLHDKEVNLGDARGRIVLLHFFLGASAPCRAQVPQLIRLYQTYHDRGLEIISVSLDARREFIKDFVREKKLKWPIVFEEPGGWKSPVVKLYELRSLPATFLLDRQGRVLHRDLRGKSLDHAVAEVFAADKAETP